MTSSILWNYKFQVVTLYIYPFKFSKAAGLCLIVIASRYVCIAFFTLSLYQSYFSICTVAIAD